MEVHIQRLLFILTLGVFAFAAPASWAAAGQGGPSQCDSDQPIVIRRTIPYPQAVKRAPLTSDRLSTTSTRYIDARRGHRPYDTVFGDRCGTHRRVLVGYDDHFGISRPEDRPYSYARRTPATGVTTFTANKHSAASVNATQQPTPLVVVVRDERAADARDDQAAADMRVRIHRDKPELPVRSGAVLITSDGTVIQVGD